MISLQILALFMLALSAACFFGPQIVAYGTRGVQDLAASPEARFVAASLTTAIALVVAAPTVGSAFGKGGEIVVAVAVQTMSLSFGLV